MGDILNVNWAWLNAPRSVKGYGMHDFIWFNVATPDLRPETLHVFVNDVSPDLRGLGPLKKCIKVPNVFFPPYAQLIITGLNKGGEKVEFHSFLKRGSTYVLKNSQGGKHRISPIISPDNCGCCSYSVAY